MYAVFFDDKRHLPSGTAADMNLSTIIEFHSKGNIFFKIPECIVRNLPVNVLYAGKVCLTLRGRPAGDICGKRPEIIRDPIRAG